MKPHRPAFIKVGWFACRSKANHLSAGLLIPAHALKLLDSTVEGSVITMIASQIRPRANADPQIPDGAECL